VPPATPPGSAGPNVPSVETEVDAWFARRNLDEEKAAIKRLNKAALDNVVYAPTGFFLGYQAWRKKRDRRREGADPVFLERQQNRIMR